MGNRDLCDGGWRLLAVLLCVYAGAGGAAHATDDPGPPAAHVVLISIDGLRPEFYLEREWPAPTIQKMAREGAYAEGVRAVFPSVTYPGHATIITGAMPARHGIAYNSPFEPEGQTGRWYWEFESFRARTLWQAASDAGLVTANISWPTSVGAPVDFNVPQIWAIDGSGDTVGRVRAHEYPEGFLAELEREATGRLSNEVYRVGDLAFDDRVGAMAAYTLTAHRPALMTVHLIHADHFQHREGLDTPGVRRALGAVDRGVGQIVDAAARAGMLERTAFVITGDHGFVDIHTQLAPNVWLAAAGLVEAQQDRGEWRAAFHTSGAPAFLHLRDPDDEAAVDAVLALIEALPTGHRKLFEVLDRAALDAAGAAPDAVLALNPKPGVTFSPRATGDAVASARGGTHGYHPDLERMHTGLIAWGAGVNAGAVAPLVGMEDIAPLVAALLGIEFDAPDGVLYPGLLAD